MKGKRFKKKKKSKKLKKLIVIIILLICISTMVFMGMKIYNWLQENKKNQDIIDEISKSISIDENIDNIEDKYNIDFENLKKANSETVAVLKVNGTSIEYPVVKTKNNDYYMTHSFDKSYNSSGWVFMDYKNKLDGTDNNIVIYAHNRRDGSMFGTLKNILTEEWQKKQENKTIHFITEKEKAEYQVFSVYKIESEDYYITTKFEKIKDFEKFIDTIKSRSMKDFGIKVTTDDEILTLSTCADNNKYRVVLHAKKSKK